MNAVNKTARKGGYPLGALFVVTAACAVLSGIFSPVIRSILYGNVGGWEVVATVAVSFFIGGLTGLFVGLHHYRRFYGAAIGVIFGAILGAASGLLAFSSSKEFPALVIASLGGAVILVCVGAVYRVTLKPAPGSSEPNANDEKKRFDIIEAELIDD